MAKTLDVKDVVTMPVATDRSAVAIAEILSQMASVMAQKKVLGLKINGHEVRLNDNLELEVELDDQTLKFEDGKLKVAQGVFYTEID